MSALLADWLVDTFVYTGALIALVLLLRQPVARHFGPQVAYALWALPLLRFLMPPIVLPASFAPAAPLAAASDPLAMDFVPMMARTSDTATSTGIADPAVGGFGMTEQLVLLWLGGAALFLLRRLVAYRRMRRALLVGARPVGEAGAVRLVETPAVRAPVAFGVRDKVVALPPDFMALHDLAARDLAIAHELAHHRGRDLLANFAAQPVLALHWFNPLAWLGWRAMRKDQEAACDARVVAGKGRAERAIYASVIAGFATGDDLELAAAMACPVLGEKSIIHRLRSLTKGDVPAARRRIGAAAIAVAGALALPLTASISYAHGGASTRVAPSDVPLPLESFDPGASAADGSGQSGEEAYDVRRDLSEAREQLQRDPVEAREQLHEAELEPMMDDYVYELEMAESELQYAMEMMESELQYANEMMESEMAYAREAAEQTLEDKDRSIAQAEAVRRSGIDRANAVNALAMTSLRAARAALATNRGLPADARENVLRSLDREIERFEGRQQSHAVPPALSGAGGAAPAQAAEVRFAFGIQGGTQVIAVRLSRSLSPPVRPTPSPAAPPAPIMPI